MAPAECHYSVTEQKCLAIVFALKKFNLYLNEATFTIQTDHQALAWFKNLRNPTRTPGTVGTFVSTLVNRSTDLVPSILNLGREMPFPLETALASHEQSDGQQRKQLADAVKDARESLVVARLHQAAQYDKGHRDMTFSVGDLILCRTHPPNDGVQRFPASLANMWQGPYRVSATASFLLYNLVHCVASDKCDPIHINDLQRFFGRSEDLDISQIPVIAG